MSFPSFILFIDGIVIFPKVCCETMADLSIDYIPDTTSMSSLSKDLKLTITPVNPAGEHSIPFYRFKHFKGTFQGYHPRRQSLQKHYVYLKPPHHGNRVRPTTMSRPTIEASSLRMEHRGTVE
jgi:hypothetical protein